VIGYAGLSHLGLVSSVAAASKGFDVVGFDPDAALVSRIDAGDLPVLEPGLPELLQAERQRLAFSSDPRSLASCRVVYISVDVPTDDQDRSDVSPVDALVGVVAGATKPGTVIVVLSQVPPGFCRERRREVEASGHVFCYQVETLIFGRAVERAVAPERFMVGLADPREAVPDALQQFLAAFGCPILPMRYESAELCKISINMFLVASVSTTNMLAEVCEAVGAEWREIAPALRLDARIGPHAYLGPGLGISGGNLRRDLITIRNLAWQHGTDASLVDTWLGASQYRRDWALRELHARVLSRVEQPVVAVWGLAYKEHTSSTKNSPALALLDALPGLTVRAFDPAVSNGFSTRAEVERVDSAIDACRGADALVVMTPWPEFKAADFAAVRKSLRRPVLIDPYGVADASAVSALGFDYARLGTGATAS
jgi:UDPglucose 6-dehydrogenase